MTIAMGITASAKTKKSPKLSSKSITLNVGKTKKLKVKGYKGKIIWSSNDPSVATVSGGKVKALKRGSTKIKAKAGSKTLTCKVKVSAPKVKKIRISKKITLIAGENYRLTAKLSPSGASGKMKWKSSAKKIVSVSSAGILTAKKKGTAKITVTCGKKKAVCKVTVKAFPKISSVSVAGPSSVSMSGMGRSYKLSLNVSSDIARGFKWSSSNPAAATVSSDGTVTAKGVGTTVITASRWTGTGGKTIAVKVPITITGSSAAGSASQTSDTSDTGSKGKPVALRAWTTLSEASSINDITGSNVKVMLVYKDGSEDYAPSFSIHGTYKNGYYTFTASTPDGLSASFQVKQKTRKIVKISASCSLKEASSIDDADSSNITVTATYEDGGTGVLTQYARSGKVSSDGKSYIYTISTTDRALSTTFSVPKKKKSEAAPDPTAVSLSIEIRPSVIYVGDSLDSVKMKVAVTMSDGTKKDVTKDVTTTFKPQQKTGEYVFYVSYGEITGKAKVDVIEKPDETEKEDPSSKIVGFSATIFNNTVYTGETLQTDRIKADVTMGDGTVKDVSSEVTNDFTPKSAAGTYDVHITYKGHTQTLSVEVKDKSQILVSIDAGFNRNSLYIDDVISKSDIIVTGKYMDGSTKRITDFDYSCDMGKTDGSVTTITVTVPGFEALSFNVLTYDRKTAVSLALEIHKLDYKPGESIDRNTIIVTAEHRDGTGGQVTDYETSLKQVPYDAIPGSTYTVVVSYGGISEEFTITVV